MKEIIIRYRNASDWEQDNSKSINENSFIEILIDGERLSGVKNFDIHLNTESINPINDSITIEKYLKIPKELCY